VGAILLIAASPLIGDGDRHCRLGECVVAGKALTWDVQRVA
jgi:hypothetical protein